VAHFEDDGRTPVTGETRKAVERAAKALEGAGFEVERFCPRGLEKARELWWKIFGVAGGILFGRMLGGREGEISPILREFNGWVAREAPHTAETLLDTWIERDLVRTEVFEQMERFPALVCPVASIPAFGRGERSWQVQGRSVRYLDAWSYSQWFNLLGMPAATVPVSLSPEGLPIGVQIVARPWEEGLVLGLARTIEEACGGLGPPTGT